MASARPREGGGGSATASPPGALARDHRVSPTTAYRYLDEVMGPCWRTLHHITASPSKIGDITRAALVLTHFEHGYIT